MPPSDEAVVWGPDFFPLMHAWMPRLFVNDEQFDWWFAWLTWHIKTRLRFIQLPGKLFSWPVGLAAEKPYSRVR